MRILTVFEIDTILAGFPNAAGFGVR